MSAPTVDVPDRLGVEDTTAALLNALAVVSDPDTYMRQSDLSDGTARQTHALVMRSLQLVMIEGLMDALERAREKGICDIPGMVSLAWRRYLKRSGRPVPGPIPVLTHAQSCVPPLSPDVESMVLDLLSVRAPQYASVPAGCRLHLPQLFLLPVTLFERRFDVPGLVDAIRALLTPYEAYDVAVPSDTAHVPSTGMQLSPELGLINAFAEVVSG